MLNLTPHDIHIYEGDTLVKTIPKSDMVLRLGEEGDGTIVETIEGIPVIKPYVYTKVIPTPPQGPDVVLIVSQMVADVLSEMPA